MTTDKAPSSLLGRYQRLIKISRNLASKLDLDLLLMEIVEAAADVADAEEASILLFDPFKEELYFQAATNLDTSLMRGTIVPLHNSIAGWIVQHKKPLTIDNPQEDERHFEHIDQITNITSKSILGVPLIAKNKVIGVMEAINKKEGPFTPEDEEIFTALGAQAAIAIENTRLFQQSDLIEEFVHELRTPLSSLSAAAHLLQHPRATQEQQEKMLNILDTEIARLSEMATSFLDVSRLESGRSQFEVKQIDVEELLIDCHDIIANEAAEEELESMLEISNNIPPLQADRDKLKMAILNLLNNAIKYNQPGGKIALRGAYLPEDEAVCIQVSDTGLGIAQDHINLIFQKFYRVPGHSDDITGSGLGLSVTQKIIKTHGGYIDVESQVGAGSTFSIYLPLSMRSSE